MRTTLLTCLSLAFLLSCEKDSEDPIIVSNYPESLDLRLEGNLTPAKDQGDYGTCWSFACAGFTEYYYQKEHGVALDLSEQHLIDCAANIGPFEGLDYIVDNGIVTEQELPYAGNRRTCSALTGEKYRIGGYATIALRDLHPVKALDTIKYALTNYGVVLSHMDGLSSLSDYQGGIYQPSDNESTNVGHIILIVGWKNDAAAENGGYWICKNSYGPDFGENGYFNIAYQKANIANAYALYLRNP